MQISDENLHHVRELMDEVFGTENFRWYNQLFKKHGGTVQSALQLLVIIFLWYAKSKIRCKIPQLYETKK